MCNILNMYLTLSPLILGGVVNMFFTKTKLYKKYKCPIDQGAYYKDGRRLLGDNKTIIGFLSMIVLCSVFQIVVGFLCKLLQIEECNDWYILNENNLLINLLIGALVGFTYMICELPNSFIKRRLDIQPGKTDRGLKGIVFFFIDQIDSLVGVVFVLWCFSHIGMVDCLLYLMLGAITHITINLILYFLKVRNNY